MDHGGVERYSIQQWLDAFTSARSRIMREVVLSHIPAFIVGNTMGYIFLTDAYALSLPWILLILLAGSVLVILIVRDSLRVMHTRQLDLILAQQIRDCRLVDRLLLGEITGAEPAAYTPWLFRRLVEPGSDRSPARVLSRVVPSLDWYVGQPRRHWRSPWNTLLIDSIIVLGITVVTLLLHYPLSMAAFYYLITAGALAGLTYSHLPKLEMLETEFKQQAKRITLGEQSIQEPLDPAAHDVTPTNRSLLPLFNQLEQELLTSSLLLRSPYSVIPGMFGAIYFPLIIQANELLFFFLFLVTGLIIIISFMIWEKTELSIDYRVNIRYRLERSDLFTRLATESPAQWLDDWRVPVLFRWLAGVPLMPRGYADNLRHAIWLCACNLDWMLDPPRHGLRVCWVLLPVQLTLVLAVLVVPGMVSGGPQAATVVHNTTGLLGFMILAASVPGISYFGRYLVWKDELVDYLRRQAAE